ncbi:lipoate--protein ligase family protein [Candidatus Thorarchaeota archaeon]|nr:MAG: lipoate--protein ligase family protein [Candidatus Thorarchaeota archaeon]
MSWRIIEDTGIDIYRNLAIDEALAKVNAGNEKKSCSIRFWQSDKSVVIGRFQCVHEEVNMPFCERKGISIARRFTGGGAVYHDLGNLNFTVCADQKAEFVSEKLMHFYEDYIGAVRDALGTLGIEAGYDDDRACIRIGERKVTGTAGWMKRGVSFLHGTLLISANLETLREALNPEEGQPVFLRDKTRIRCKSSKRDIVTNICDEIADLPSLKELKEAILRSIERFTGVESTPSRLTSEERDTAEALYQSRYSRSTWNLGTPVQSE